jgi:hypothetical protein
MESTEYLRESARTASGQFHTELVDPAEMDFMLHAVISAGAWADRLKRALFYGKVPDGKSRWSTSSLKLRPEMADLVHATLGCVTESAEMAEHIRDVLAGAKPLDQVNLVEEIGDQLWYIAMGLRRLGSDFGAAFASNIAKLRKRFPDKFTEDAAVNRDLAGERAVLEESNAGKLSIAEMESIISRGGSVRISPDGTAEVFESGQMVTGNAAGARAILVNVPDSVSPEQLYRLRMEWHEIVARTLSPLGMLQEPRNEPLPEPELGSWWEHKDGEVYQVMFLANPPAGSPHYPRMIVYLGPNGRIWVRRADDWHLCMRQIPSRSPQPEPSLVSSAHGRIRV